MEQIKLGIIGIGRWGKNYLRTCTQINNLNVAYICATKEQTCKKALEEINLSPLPKTTTNYKEILNDPEIKAVIIATPAATHYELAKESLKAGKHVLVEKPVAFHTKEVEDLIKISEETNKIFMAGHLHLFNPGILKLKQNIKEGIFGKIRYIYSASLGPGPVRPNMSALWDYFPHDLTIILYLLENLPTKIIANGASYLNPEIENVVSMDLYFPNKVFTSSIASWIHPVKKRDVIVVGEKMSAVFDDYAKTDKLRYYNAQAKEHKTQIIDDAKPLTEQIKHFLDCIKENKTPLTGPAQALHVTKVLEAAEKSLKTGLPVELSP